jgi:hypothetical protein
LSRKYHPEKNSSILTLGSLTKARFYCLVTLISLNQTNAELGLGLNFESLWETELTSSNILILFITYFAED